MVGCIIYFNNEENMTVYKKYQQLKMDTSWIGLEKGRSTSDYFCTPKKMKIIGWENNIHYGFIKGYDEMIFAIHPEGYNDTYVFPLAYNFEDFLRLILACGSVTPIEQIFMWDKKQFMDFIVSEDNEILPKQKEILDQIQKIFKLEPMDDPFEYVKEIQSNFDASKIEFSNDYYDTLGLARPDKSQAEDHGFEFEPVSFAFITRKKD